MNVFNRIVAILLWLALLFGALTLAVAPMASAAWLQMRAAAFAGQLAEWQHANPTNFLIWQATIGIGALLEDGRQSQVELAERIPLSATAIARRIRALEERGVIQGYQARIDRQALGLTMTVVVHVGLRSQNEDLLKSFEEAVTRAPSVVSCHLMSGEDDYLVTVMARDLADFERIHKEQLSRLPGVARSLQHRVVLHHASPIARRFFED